MSGARTGSNSRKERKAQMMYGLKDMISETSFTSRSKKIGDTNLGPFNMEGIRDRMYRRNASKLARRMVRNEIVQASAFLPAMQCPELMIECAKHYDPQTR